jgi:UDP-glucose 4-epimerase
VIVAVTGGAGFIGSNLVNHLEEQGHDVRVIDNLSTGQMKFIGELPFAGEVVELDLVEGGPRLTDAIDGVDAVVHLAANADVRHGWEHPRRDLEQNVIATLNLCEAMRATGVRRLLFASTGSVYGETATIPTPEDCPFPVQTSLYGASKAAAEGFLDAYAEGGHLDVTIFRFVSILGPRYTHGHIIDFLRKLRRQPDRLQILGDGTQRKSYLDVSDCVRAITGRLVETERREVYNLGVDDYCTVRDSAAWICDRLGISPELEFTGGDRGWVGDNPFIWLDTRKIVATGWKPSLDIRTAVERTVDYIQAHQWVLDLADPR